MDLSRFAPKRWPRMSAGAAVTLLIGLLYTVSYWAYRGWRVGSDGHYSWIFARSIAFDGDLHFANDYAACGDPFNAGHDEGAGRPANPFYFGPGLLWSIPLRVARALVHLPADATASARAGCEGPYVDWGLCLAPLCGALTLWLGYKVARRYASDAAAACAVAVVGLCSPLAHYAALITSYSHVWAALGCAVALYGYARAIENEASRLRWFVCGLAVGFGALMRIQGGAMLLLPGLWLLRDLVVRARARQLREAGEVIARGLITLAGFALVFSLQLWVYKVLYGHYWVIPQGRSYVLWGHGHPWLTLFAARAALFTWHPLLYVCLLGVFIGVIRPKWRFEMVALLLPCALDTYVNSCAYWHGGASFGARRHVALAAPLVVFAAVGGAWLWEKLRGNPRRIGAALAASVIAPWAVINVGMSLAMQNNRLAYEGSVRAGDIYGVGLQDAMNELEAGVGNPFAWPGALPFALRYRTHPAAWTPMTNGGYFDHGYRPVVLRGPDTIEFAQPNNAASILDGWTRRQDGLWLSPNVPARAIVELAFPYVTHIELAVLNERNGDAHVRVYNRRTVSGAQVFDRTVPGNRQSATEVSVPVGSFDSGINELTFEADRPVRIIAMRFIDRMSHDTSVR